MSTTQQAIAAIRAQIVALQAENPVNRPALRQCQRELREIRESRTRARYQEILAQARAAGDAALVASTEAAIAALDDDEISDWRDAFAECNDYSQTPALFDEREWFESIAILLRNLGNFPQDEQDPRYQRDNRLPRLDRIRNVLARVARSTATEIPEPVKANCFAHLRNHFGETLPQDPVVSGDTAAIAALQGGALDSAGVREALRQLRIED